jgi:hypothetical protein
MLVLKICYRSLCSPTSRHEKSFAVFILRLLIRGGPEKKKKKKRLLIGKIKPRPMAVVTAFTNKAVW